MADDSKPVYLRLREIIAASILDGDYSDGDLLPSVRAFAATALERLYIYMWRHVSIYMYRLWSDGASRLRAALWTEHATAAPRPS